MSKVTVDMPPRHAPSSLWVVVLLLGPLLLIPLGTAFSWLDPQGAASTLVGCLIAAAGGLLTGLAAERLLHRGKGSTEQLIGLAVTTALGLLTIGYLYLVHLRGPMEAIDTPQRIVAQLTAFLTYLTAQAAGIVISLRW